MLEESIDKALTKADYNWDGFISWDEYVYSLGDTEVNHHMNPEPEKHEFLWIFFLLTDNQHSSNSI